MYFWSKQLLKIFREAAGKQFFVIEPERCGPLNEVKRKNLKNL